MRKTLIALALASGFMALPVAAPSAEAQSWRNNDHRSHSRSHNNRRNHYDNNGRYRNPRALTRNDRVWRGRDGRYHCRRGNGTTGLIIGGAAGALLGRELDGGRDRTLGTILGAAGGGLLGREIDRGGLKCR